MARVEGKPERYYGDSWFASVTVALWFAKRGHAFVGAVKTSSKLFPKAELEDRMKLYPSGASLIMECDVPGTGNEGIKLLAIGYKYNKKKVLLFIATKNAGSTQPGDPYIARYNDKLRNVRQREVERPAIISEYFKHSMAVDAHNQARQGILKLEKRWVVQSCWMRLNTTLLGMIVTDAWKAYRCGTSDKKTIGVVDFADRLAYDMINNNEANTLRSTYIPAAATTPVPMTVDIPGDEPTQVAALSPLTAVSMATILSEHGYIVNPEMEKTPDSRTGNCRAHRRTCMKAGCKAQTQFCCENSRCQKKTLNPNGRVVYGTFYCLRHWADHHKEVHDWYEAGLLS